MSADPYHRQLKPRHALPMPEMGVWGAVCFQCGTLWSRDPAHGGEARGHPLPAPRVTVGDSFGRIGDLNGPWEVTVQAPDKWRVERGDERAYLTTEEILDPARWQRVRAL